MFSIKARENLPNESIKSSYEHQLIVAEGDYVIVHGLFSGNGRPVAWPAADIVRIENGRLAEHWDVLQDEATKAESKERPADVWRPLP